MSLLNLREAPAARPFSPFVLGFRPFFFGASLFAVLAMLAWIPGYHFGLTPSGLVASHWHAHEMLFGFALAVVSGFLLTAIRNWTGVQTVQYGALAGLVVLWLAARISMLFGMQALPLTALFDLSYNLLLWLAMLLPVWRVRQWTQAGILAKILLLGVCNALFYLGALGWLEMGVYWGLWGGVYLLIALVMTIGRRVLPFFIEKGVGYPLQLKNSRALDVASLLLFIGFALCDVILLNFEWSGYFAAGLVAVSLLRMYNWHTPGIWRAPLLWGLYGAFVFITLGFLLFALAPYLDWVSRSLAVHALTVGGVGLITLSMMSRVTLGHTGRSIHEPLRYTGLAQLLIVAGAVMRVIAPMLWARAYDSWILLSQLCWIAGFALFLALYARLLLRPRTDGREG